MDEREVQLAWRELFRGPVTPDVLSRAEALLEGLSGESPLHIRLANELAELTRGQASRSKRRANSRG